MGSNLLGVQLAQSWAEGLAAVGTTAAFLVGALVYWRSRRDRVDDEMNQARLVYRTRATSNWGHWDTTVNGNVSDVSVTFDVVNHSGEPISELAAHRVKRDGSWEDTRPTEYSRVPETLRGRTGTTVATIHLPSMDPALAQLFDIEKWDVEFEFTDARGRRWARRGLEQPRRRRRPSTWSTSASRSDKRE